MNYPDDTDEYYLNDVHQPYYLKDDTGYGQCPQCDSYLEMWGATSDGDGDLYDALGCPNCREEMDKINVRYYDDDFNEFDDYDNYVENGHFDDTEELTHWQTFVARLHRFTERLRQLDPLRHVRYCVVCGRRGCVAKQDKCLHCWLPF